jgi:hypothetical protein
MPELPDRIRQFYAEAALPDKVVERLTKSGRQARRQRMVAWASLAAAALVVISTWFGISRSRPKMTAEVVNEQVRSFFSQPDARLDFASSDPVLVRRWLEMHDGPSDFTIPAGLVGKATVGCEILSLGEQRVFIVCFVDDGTKINHSIADASERGRAGQTAIVHLVLAPKKAFATPPPGISHPHLAIQTGWAFAAWTDDSLVYMLATDAGVKPLRRALKA